MANSFSRAVDDIRQKVVETGWFGKPVTPLTSSDAVRPQQSDIASPAIQSKEQEFDAWWGVDHDQASAATIHDELNQWQTTDNDHDL